jgi:hypothetical protein
MAVGFPVKADYATGDVLTAAQMNDLAGTLNTVPSTVAALANPVINGGMDIWQRGTSVAVGTAFTYGPDRWQGYRSGLVAGLTLSRQVTGDTTNLPNIQYAMRIQRDSGNSSTATVAVGQSFESVNSIPFAGKAVTLSFYARKGANYSGGTLNVGLTSGTGTDQNINSVAYTGAVTVTNPLPTLTTTWTRYSGTGTVAATATELAITAAFTPTGTAGANDWVEITGVQIDVGTYSSTTAPTFRRTGGTIQQELAACQRYYYRAADTSSQYGAVGMGQAYSATGSVIFTAFPSQMRTKPSSVNYSNLILTDAVSTFAVTTLTIDSNTTSNSYGAVNATATGLTTYRPMYLRQDTSTAGYIAFSAEL